MGQGGDQTCYPWISSQTPCNMYDVYLFDILFTIQTPHCSVVSPYHASLKNTCFQNKMYAEATLGEFAISLVFVISCEPAKVGSES